MLYRFIVLVALLTVISGCNNTDGLNRASVEGVVTLDGRPLESGSVCWYPLETGPAIGADIKNGKYKLNRKDGPVVGDYRIEIRGPQKPTGKKVASTMNPKIMVDEIADIVPDKYRFRSTMKERADSVLTACVTKGKNTIDFKLSTD